MFTAETESPTQLRPTEQPREAAGWSALRLLPMRAWLTLVGVLLVALASAAIAEWLAEAPQTQAAVIFLAVLAVGLLIALSRLLAADAVRREALRAASERHAQDLEGLIEARTRELSALSTHLQKLSEKEKSELARNLHDELGGLLTAAKIDLSWLQSRVPEPALRERLAQLGAVLDEAMDLKRRVVEDLRPSLLDHFGLPTALRAYVDAACAKAGLRTQLELPDDGAPMPNEAAIALFRIVQEGVTNIIRHASAQAVTLVFVLERDSCRFSLSDDGCGFDAADPKFRWSHGIMGMRQRVHTLGGQFEVESTPSSGTTLRVTIPRRN
ncbi:MAG TPA: sensor histidine kinase [Steroidobacteraceae bacterium]|jgi:signal transduction histidine kinase|nr:sensor histidine kinase [Steroidobacteraceae bacterium]